MSVSSDTSGKKYAISLVDVQAAAQRIKGYVHRTPIMTCRTLDALAGRHLVFKPENLQKVGAFKARGAFNAVLSIRETSPDTLKKGVITHSSGNHAQALALAARDAKCPAHIIMPSNAPSVKKDAVRGYGATVHECEPTLEAREATARAVEKETGGVFIHPYNNPLIMAGQGTVALELLEQAEEARTPLDAVLVQVGGGGLLSGCTITLKSLRPEVKVFAAEPKGADDTYRSLKSGKWVPSIRPDTVADGLLTSTGDLTFPIIKDQIDDIFVVDDREIIRATKLVWERMKLVIEPSAAVTLAVALYNADFKRAAEGCKNIGVVFSGGNVDFERAVTLFKTLEELDS
ncbi:serine racemase-like protein [Dacryopinax primogenitus]|uniref:Serine racemase n=1 Tax=Dacryopinax primogenitus (strain DJM 731) TaxID=1858805 RepID=M5G693_DACPD|nr:serine racemase-like protein [Dacryopinax primogenitus]EJU01352.1 serine racemase-like protein [Dacryopinax primogenitus]